MRTRDHLYNEKEIHTMAVITIIGAGMMGSALAFPARENGNTVRLVGTPLDREIIDTCRKTGDRKSVV